MNEHRRYVTGVTLIVVVIGLVSVCLAEEKRSVTPRDCVTVRDLQHDVSTWRSTIKISPDGKNAIYPVVSPNLETNENDVELDVRSTGAPVSNSKRPILVGNISDVRWRPDAKNVTLLWSDKGKVRLEQLDTATGNHVPLLSIDADIREYTIDSEGSTVVYAVNELKGEKKEHSEDAMDRGYRIPFQAAQDERWPSRKLFVVHRSNLGWTDPVLITIRSPLSHRSLTSLSYGSSSGLQPTISPDGKKLLVSYWDLSQEMPDDWRRSGAMQLRNTAGVIQAFRLLVLVDLITGETSVPVKTPFIFSAPLWMPDGKSFVVASRPEINSDLERESFRTNLLAHGASAHVFWVETVAGRVEDVAAKPAFPVEGVLCVESDGDLLLRTSSMSAISRYSRTGGVWREVSSWNIPEQIGSQIATDGNFVIGEFSDTTTPPQLEIFRLGQAKVEVLAELNPEFSKLALAAPKEVHWKTSTGFDASGLLLLPPGYKEGVRYPLVIQTKPFTSSFVCSFGNFPSFAPQPIASAGIIYLGQIPTKGSTQREESYYPKKYPGNATAGSIAEAAFATDLWDSAVQSLDVAGMIDNNRVGVIGFSRTGWYTEFMLAHAKTHYRAATVADNVQYSMGEYWLIHDADTIKQYDILFGGPPYGPTLKNWLDYSVSFNLDKIHSPLLMEQMGYGTLYNNPEAPPLSLTGVFEVFTGLNHLGRAVELYYYPNEEHLPDHPKARLATMQRNVDWYRFWLQDYERPDAEDSLQYSRWRTMRRHQEEAVFDRISAPKAN